MPNIRNQEMPQGSVHGALLRCLKRFRDNEQVREGSKQIKITTEFAGMGMPHGYGIAWAKSDIVAFACDWNRHMQESRGPLSPKSPESLKKVFPGALRPGVSKKCRKVPKDQKHAIVSGHPHQSKAKKPETSPEWMTPNSFNMSVS